MIVPKPSTQFIKILNLLRKSIVTFVPCRNNSDYAKPEYGLGRAWKIIKGDFKNFGKSPEELEKSFFPREVDVLIIGGGIMGSSIAYWLKQRCPEGFTCTVIERDLTYSRSSTALSVGGIRQQFSVPENIQMSMFSAQFLRNIREHLSVLDLDPPDLQFNPQGYLFLSTEKGAAITEENHKLQISLGAKVQLLTPLQLKKKFPWLNTDGIVLGSYGLENEGWFDPWSLLEAFRRKALSLGVRYINGEVVGFEKDTFTTVRSAEGPVEQSHTVVIKTPDGAIHPMTFSICVNAAGPQAGHVAKLANIGIGKQLLSHPLPVEPRKRYVYVFHCNHGGHPGLECPLVVDPSGIYFRREDLGGNFICGRSPPTEEEEDDTSTLDVNYDFFQNNIWPILSKRVPAFESIRVKSAWAGLYDYNTADQNGIIGAHPHHSNFYFANGFSGHGIQQAPAVGRAIMELIMDNGYQTIDLTRLGFERFMTNELVKESNIV